MRVQTAAAAQMLMRRGFRADRSLGKHNFKRRKNQVAVTEKIRIRLKSYDHTLIDQASEKIVETAK